MALFKASMLLEIVTNPEKTFNSISRSGGWSESFFYTAATPARVRDQLVPLAILRARLLPTTGNVVGYRVQQVNPTGASQSFPASLSGGVLATDVPQMALLCRAITAAGLNARQLRIAGIPDARVVNGEYQPSAQFQGALQAYFAEIMAHWQMQAIDRSLPVVPTVGVSIAGVVTFAGAHSLNAGDRVKFFRTRDTLGKTIKGIWTITDVPDTLHVTLGNWKGNIVEGGRLRKYVLIYPAFQNGTITTQRIITRKVGRAFFPYHGRVSKRT